MILRLDIERLRTLDEVRDFMAGSAPVDFRFVKRADAYGFVRRVLVRSRYIRLSRPDKGLVRRFLIKVTGFSRAQIARLIFQYRETGRIEDRRRGPKRPFPRRYTKTDIGPMAEVDETLGGLCGAVTRRMMQRHTRCSGMCGSSVWQGSRTAICTGFASRPRTGGGALWWSGRGRRRYRSESAASLIPRVGRAFCEWIRSIRATWMGRRVCTRSISWTRSRSTSSWPL